MNEQTVVENVWRVVEPVVEEQGLELVEVEFQRESQGWVLRLYIDHTDGVGLEDCVRVSREVGDLLDVKIPIEHKYRLEVSSPGMDRPIRKPEHFRRYFGQKVKITLSSPPGKRRKIVQGILGEMENDIVKLDCDQGTMEIPFQQIAKTRLVPSWDQDAGRGARR